MKKEQYYIYPSFIWVSLKLVVYLALFIYILLSNDYVMKVYYMQEVFFIVILVDLYKEIKKSAAKWDEITIFYIIGRRRIKKERIKVIQLVKQRGSYHMLIILDDHKMFEDDLSRRRRRVENFAVLSPIKVVHMHVPGKKREQISSSLKDLGYKVMFMDCDAMQ